MIVLPQRVHANDCTVCDYPEDRQVEILTPNLSLI